MNATAEDIKEGYKLTKVGLIPDDWKVIKLGDIGNIVSGLTYSPDDVREDGMLVLRSSNIYDRLLKFDDNVFVEASDLKFNPVQEGDILICVRNGSKSLIGKNTIIPKSAEGLAFGAFMSVFRSEYNNYLFQLFDTDLYNRQIHDNLGATINSINGSDLKNFIFPLPSLPERQKIAEILSTWDQAIQKCEQTVKELKNRNKGLAKELLTGKKRLRGFTDEWQSVKIGEVTKKFSNRNKELIDARIYSVTNTNGFVLQSDHFSREVAGDDLSNYKTISKGDFAYNPARINVGSIAYFEQEQGVISSLYVCFRTTKRIEDKFLYYWLSLEKTIHDFGRFGEGGVRIYLWYELFAKIKLVLPSIEEQKAIISVLDEAHDELKLYEKKSAVLQEQKKGLMQKLLTGEIRVNVK